MLPLDVLVFGVVDLVVMLLVDMIHLLNYVLSVGHKFTHGI